MEVITKAKQKFKDILNNNNLFNKDITIRARGLSSKEAIGNPERNDFPLMVGKEVMIQAEFREDFGQAFTDHPSDFTGDLQEIMELSLDNNHHRALFIATVNAVLRSLKLTRKTIHCKDEEPSECAAEMLEWLQENCAKTEKIGIIGYHPAIVKESSLVVGPENIRVSDLNQERIGENKFGIEIWNGNERNEELIKETDLILATGSSVVNDTIDDLLYLFDRYTKDYYFFGNTIAGVATLLDLPRLCFCGR
ncbi:Rossmann-like domain-containing protein [Sporohalobacter salinus]|uniref:Rossmann-like domain-containing protein n=1 Tax=Sporohalobacter salinus TaxID=1494606 RepID=UPI0019605EF3|nr:DUF364 domain-containing protein [Sporohalobacter salinus]MBM7622510.1 uncharacterized protein (DUF4213/DUF364 family) [Sporohalobacter salinus]